MEKNSKIYLAGHSGLVGSAIMRSLERHGYHNVIYRTLEELDLCNQAAVFHFFEQEKPDYVFLAAAKVGGILANNTYPAQFIYENLAIETNVIHAAYLNKVKKLLFLGSSCIYPKIAPQPIKEEYLLTSSLESTNEAYALAKISGLKTCQYYRRQYGVDYISAMPTNLYGPRDNFNLETSHVIPAMIRKFHEAKLAGTEATMWGTGTARREFLYIDDLADALLYLMNHYSEEIHINVGVGEDLSIKELAELVQKVVGHTGEIIWDNSKPDGTPRKLLDISRLKATGFHPKVSLEEGLNRTYQWYLENLKQIV